MDVTTIEVTNKQIIRLSLVKQHRLVSSILASEITTMHGLTLKTKKPPQESFYYIYRLSLRVEPTFTLPLCVQLLLLLHILLPLIKLRMNVQNPQHQYPYTNDILHHMTKEY